MKILLYVSAAEYGGTCNAHKYTNEIPTLMTVWTECANKVSDESYRAVKFKAGLVSTHRWSEELPKYAVYIDSNSKCNLYKN